MGWGAAVAALLTALLPLIQKWLAMQAEKKETIDVANIQLARKALQKTDGSIDAVVAEQHDRVQRALSGS